MDDLKYERGIDQTREKVVEQFLRKRPSGHLCWDKRIRKVSHFRWNEVRIFFVIHMPTHMFMLICIDRFSIQ